MIKAQRTYLPSRVVRRAAYDRLAAGTHLTFSEWIAVMKGRFEAAHPEHRKQGDPSRHAFDRWLERLTLEDVK